MKKKLTIIGIFLTLALVVWWLLYNPRGQPSAQTSTNQTKQLAPLTPPQQSQQTQTASTSDPTPESNPVAWIEKRCKQMDEDRQKGLNEWRTPIEFYGKVVDEKTNPVAGAQIDFDCNDLSPKGTSFYHTQSTADGLFSIRDISGKLLGVKVSKQGYYAYRPFGADFYYAGQNQNFIPDAENPIVFRLRKKGNAEKLVVIKRNYKIARDGTPVGIDLVKGNATSGPSGDLVVECWTDDQGKKSGQRYNWHCLVTIPNGGLILEEEEFPFLAPENKYVPTAEIAMPAERADWKNDVDLKFFYRLADGRYGRMKFSMIAGGDHFFMIESFLNPSGSRNLEYDSLAH